jgi:beta propeller repeat protein
MLSKKQAKTGIFFLVLLIGLLVILSTLINAQQEEKIVLGKDKKNKTYVPINSTPLDVIPAGSSGLECFWFDSDTDGDIDQADFTSFQACISGAGVPVAKGCYRFDSDNDDDVDSNDSINFQECLSGTDVLYADFSPQRYSNLRVLKDIEQAACASQPADILEPSPSEAVCLKAFANAKNTNQGIFIANSQVYLPDSVYFTSETEEIGNERRYFLKTSDNNVRLLFNAVDLSEETCVPSYGNDYYSMQKDLLCVYSQARKNDLSIPYIFNATGSARQDVIDYLDELVTRKILQSYSLTSDVGQGWVEVVMKYTGEVWVFKIELTEQNLYGPETDVAPFSSSLNELINDSYFVSIDGYSIYASDQGVPRSALRSLLAEDGLSFKERINRTLDIIEARSNNFVDCSSNQNYKVFVANTLYSAEELLNTRTLESADAICNSEASRRNIPGNFKAWLSTPEKSAGQRLYPSSKPYVNLAGDLVASNWDDFIDGSLDSPVTYSSETVMTSTNSFGEYESGSPCDSCTVVDADDDGTVEGDAEDLDYFTDCLSRTNDALRPLTENLSNQKLHTSYAISNDIVVWEDDRNSFTDIYALNISSGKETQVTSTPDVLEYYPSVSESNIVFYRKNSDTGYSIFLYNLATTEETQIYPNEGFAGLNPFAAIDGNNVVFSGSDGKILLYDITTGTLQKVTNYPADSPSISGNNLVWRSNSQLWTCIIGQNCGENDVKTQVTKSPHSVGFYPHISGNIIVWYDYKDVAAGGTEIYMCNLSLNGQTGGCLADDSKTRVTNSPGRDESPVTDGNLIVWQKVQVADKVYQCDISLNGQTGGCLADDSKTLLGMDYFPETRATFVARYPAISNGKTVFSVYNDPRAPSKWLIWMYAPDYNPMSGCEWADLDKNDKMNLRDQSLFMHCFVGGESVGGTIVSGKSSSTNPDWTDGANDVQCGLEEQRASLYCVEQPPEVCTAAEQPQSVQASSSSSDSKVMFYIPGINEPNIQDINEYYTNVGANVPYATEISHLQLSTWHLRIGYWDMDKVNRELSRLGKYGFTKVKYIAAYEFYQYSDKGNLLEFHSEGQHYEDLRRTLGDTRSQIVVLTAHGREAPNNEGPTDEFQFSCEPTVDDALRVANMLNNTYNIPIELISYRNQFGSCTIPTFNYTDDKKTEYMAFVNATPGIPVYLSYQVLGDAVSSGVVPAPAYSFNKEGIKKKSLFIIIACYQNMNKFLISKDAQQIHSSWINMLIGTTARKISYTDEVAYDFKVFVDYFTTEKRYKTHKYELAGPDGKARNIMDQIDTMSDHGMYGAPSYHACYFNDPVFGRIPQFCVIDQKGGGGPEPQISPEVFYVSPGLDEIKGYSIITIKFDNPINQEPGTVVPESQLEIDWEGCTADWERSPSLLRTLYLDTTSMSSNDQKRLFELEKRYYKYGPYAEPPIWNNSDELSYLADEYSDEIQIKLKWTPQSAFIFHRYICRPGMCVTPDHWVQGERFISYNVWWGREGTGNPDMPVINDSVRKYWPNSRFLKIKVHGANIESYPAGFKLNGNNEYASEISIYLAESLNIHGTKTAYGFPLTELDGRVLEYPVRPGHNYYNGYGSYGEDYEIWIPCTPARIVGGT